MVPETAVRCQIKQRPLWFCQNSNFVELESFVLEKVLYSLILEIPKTPFGGYIMLCLCV